MKTFARAFELLNYFPLLAFRTICAFLIGYLNSCHSLSEIKNYTICFRNHHKAQRVDFYSLLTLLSGEVGTKRDWDLLIFERWTRQFLIHACAISYVKLQIYSLRRWFFQDFHRESINANFLWFDFFSPFQLYLPLKSCLHHLRTI